MQDCPLEAAEVVLHQFKSVVHAHVGTDVQVRQLGLEAHLVLLEGALEGRPREGLLLVSEKADRYALDVGRVAAAVAEVQRLLQHQPGELAPGLDHDDGVQRVVVREGGVEGAALPLALQGRPVVVDLGLSQVDLGHGGGAVGLLGVPDNGAHEGVPQHLVVEGRPDAVIEGDLPGLGVVGAPDLVHMDLDEGSQSPGPDCHGARAG